MPRDQLHHEVVAGLVGEVVDDADHARMAELFEQPRLDLETGDVRDVEQAFDRHLHPALAIVRAVDGAHRAARDRALDLKTAREFGPGRQEVVVTLLE